jgi:hypothetical protein
MKKEHFLKTAIKNARLHGSVLELARLTINNVKSVLISVICGPLKKLTPKGCGGSCARD